MPILRFRNSIAPEGASYNSHVAMQIFVGGGFSLRFPHKYVLIII